MDSQTDSTPPSEDKELGSFRRPVNDDNKTPTSGEECGFFQRSSKKKKTGRRAEGLQSGRSQQHQLALTFQNIEKLEMLKETGKITTTEYQRFRNTVMLEGSISKLN